MLERVIDRLADELKMDPAELRKKNLIPHFENGHDVVTGLKYDSGNYPAALDKLLAHVDYTGLRKEQAELRKKGRYVGVGVGYTSRSAASDHHRSPAPSASRAASGRAPSSASIRAERRTSSSVRHRTARAKKRPSLRSSPMSSASASET
jgi:CO/xanthine dehydrogenase Mo-binding subunit